MGNFNRDNNRGGSGRGFGGGNRSFGGRGGYDRSDREMFKTTCANCGKECEVPFKPTGSRPVYCNDCFKKNDTDSAPRGGSDRRGGFSERPSVHESLNSSQVEAIHTKLDRILELLSAAPSKANAAKEAKAVEEIISEVKEAKPKKKAKKQEETVEVSEAVETAPVEEAVETPETEETPSV